MMRVLVMVALLVGCGPKAPPRELTGRWPQMAYDYDATTKSWTVYGELGDVYQEIISVYAVFKSPQWRAARGNRDAYFRGLEGEAREQIMVQARAETMGPYEVELLVTTWERRENDLDKGDRSVWKVRLIDEAGNEIKPLEIVKDKRPAFTIRSDYPSFGDFATAYIVRFPRDKALLGDGVKRLRMRISSVRGFLAMEWTAEQ